METEKSDLGYIPKKIQEIAQTLLENQNVDAALDTLRSMYPNKGTLRSSLSKLKSVIVASNIRHSTYVEKMAQREELIKNDVVAQNFTTESLQRMKEFYHFQSCDLKRQLHIQKKLKLGQGHGFFSNSTDMEFFLHLQTAPDYVHQIHLDMDETRLVQEQQAHKMKCLSNTVVRIENADQIVANARKILKFPTDQNPCALATALAITTGRRMIEIFQKGTFTIASPTSPFQLVFTGQAKAGLQEIVSIQENKAMEYTIPVLAKAADILASLDILRDHCKATTTTYKQMNSNWSQKLNAHVKQHVHSELGFHDLRTMYALITYEAFKPHTYSINGWICNTLGHSGLNMSVSYTRMQIYGIGKLRRDNREAAEDYMLA